MSKKRKGETITAMWVHEDFKNFFKAESARRGKSMVEFSKELSDPYRFTNKIVEQFSEKKKKKGFGGLDLGF